MFTARMFDAVINHLSSHLVLPLLKASAVQLVEQYFESFYLFKLICTL